MTRFRQPTTRGAVSNSEVVTARGSHDNLAARMNLREWFGAENAIAAAVTGSSTASVAPMVTINAGKAGGFAVLSPYTLNAEVAKINSSGNLVPAINATFDRSHSAGSAVLYCQYEMLNAAWFGLSESNSAADNDTALARFVAAVKATTLSGIFPAGTFNISDTITITDVGGMKLRGLNGSYVSKPTIFNWQGGSSDPAFLTVGARESRFGGFKIYINGASYSLFCGVQVHTSTTAGFTSSNNTYENIVIEPSTTGVLTRGMSVDKDGPNGDLNNDYMTFEDCNVRNAQYAYYMDATQAKNTRFIECLSEGDAAGNTDYGLYCIGGSFHWSGGGINASGLYDFYANNLSDVSSITNIQSESSGGFLHLAGPTAAQVVVNVSGVRWDRSSASTTLAASGRIIRINTAGQVHITASQFTAKTSEQMRVRFDSATNPHGSVWVGQSFFWDGSTNGEDIFETPNLGSLYLRGNIWRDASSNFHILPDRTDGSFLNVGVPRVVTIDTGAITARSSHVRVNTEGDAATDDLVTINGGTPGDILFIEAFSSSRTVVVKHGTGNIRLAGAADFSLDSAEDQLALKYSGVVSAWCQFPGNNA